MNGFNGFTTNQITSVFLTFITYGIFTLLPAFTIWKFYRDTKPIAGRIVKSAWWYLFAGFCYFWTQVALVWAAPAEASFVSLHGNHLFPFDQVNMSFGFAVPFIFVNPALRFAKGMIFVWAFGIIGTIALVIGMRKTARGRKALLAGEKESSAESKDTVDTVRASATPEVA